MHKIHFRPGRTPLWEDTTLPRPLDGWLGDTPPHVISLSPSASRSRRIRNEVVIGPRDNVFSGPAMALDGPPQAVALPAVEYTVI